ncbi:MAG: pantetheine-phosphate adenylyltransferase [Bacillota bacterium]
MLTLAVCPGSFDPVTMGHLDIITRAASIFDNVIVAILENQAKDHMFSLEERLEMLRVACAHLPNVQVDHFEGLLVDYVRACGAHVVIRGLRAVSDFEFELTMALMNRKLDPSIETMYIMTSMEYSVLSSSIVKEVAGSGGDIHGLVPEPLVERVSARCRRKG